MISYFSSLIIIFNSINKNIFINRIENVDLKNSVNRINFTNILSSIKIPYFDNSAMDGYSFSYNKFNNNINFENKFFILDIIKAGDFKKSYFYDSDYVIEIMTGSRIPFLFNSVIRYEDTVININNPFEIIFRKKIFYQDNVRISGEDFYIGDYVLKKGTIISGSKIMALSRFNFLNINVLKNINIYLFCTGNELYDEINLNINNNLIPNSLGNYIISFLENLNLKVNYLGIVKDDKTIFLKQIKKIIYDNEYNLIITTGAISKGKADFLSSSLIDLGFEVLFHGLNIKPGKPILFGKFHKNYIFSLPGNPLSSAIGLRFFIYNFLMYFNGIALEKPFRAILSSDYHFNNKYDLFLKCYTYFDNNSFYTIILDEQQSFKIRSFSDSNSFLLIKKNEFLKKGEFVDIYFHQPHIYF